MSFVKIGNCIYRKEHIHHIEILKKIIRIYFDDKQFKDIYFEIIDKEVEDILDSLNGNASNTKELLGIVENLQEKVDRLEQSIMYLPNGPVFNGAKEHWDENKV